MFLPILTDYLDLEMMARLQKSLSSVTGSEICLCRPDNKPFVGSCRAADKSLEFRAPVMVGGSEAGSLVLVHPAGEYGANDTNTRNLLELLAEVVGGLCQRESMLRDRIDELGLLHKLTAEFTTQNDLQKVLDTVAATVVEVLDAKGCLIRLLSDDGTELYVKSVAGLSDEYLAKGPILLAESEVDRDAITTMKCVYVRDLRNDPRGLYQVQSAWEGLVSSLFSPMAYKGHVEGVLRVYSDHQREFDWFERSLLTAISAQAAAAIVSTRLHHEAVLSASMKRQLNLAGAVQRRMIPQSCPEIPGCEIATEYVPSYELSGDFYDFLHLGEGNLGLVVCDVVGKGVRASLLMASIRASLRAHASAEYDMSIVMDFVNGDLCDDSLVSDFATMFYGVFDIVSRRLTYTNAGHVPPMLVRDGEVTELAVGGGVLGIDTDFVYKTGIVDCRSGDVILLYTDGLIEAMNFDDEYFGRDRIISALLDAASQGFSAEGIVKHVAWMMRKFAGLQKRLDDLTLVVLKIS